MASSPTYKPSIFVGRTNRKKLAPLLDPETAKKDNYPGLDRVTEGLYPPGSTFKPVTALAAMQERLISPFQTIQCTPSYSVTDSTARSRRSSRTGTRTSNQPMTLPEALGALLRHVLLQPRLRVLRAAARPWPSAAGLGEPLRLRRADRDRRRPGAGRPAADAGVAPGDIHGEDRPGCWQIDRLWKPGDSIQLAIGQKDLLVTPLQMVRFYSLIANGGKLVTPHVALLGRRARRAAATTSTRRRRSRAGSTRPRSQSSATASTGPRTPPYGTATAVFGNFPIPIAGKTGTAEKVVNAARLPAPVTEDQSWWCGYGPADATETPKIAVCAVIENGGHGGTAAAPAALKVFEHFFHARRPAASGRSTPTDGRPRLHPHRAVPRQGAPPRARPRRRRSSPGSTG